MNLYEKIYCNARANYAGHQCAFRGIQNSNTCCYYTQWHNNTK
jgi:hypothetical protein